LAVVAGGEDQLLVVSCGLPHMDYYSARLFVICLVDDGKLRRRHTCDYPFVVFRAKTREQAFERALALGKEQEARYKNNKGQWVRWALVQVETIKRLGRRLDGREIGSLLDVHRSDRPIPFDKRFYPKKSRVIYD
jgi:hypothetical protein